MKIDISKLRKVKRPLEVYASLQKKPKKLKKDRSKLQVKKDSPNSKLWKRKADKAFGEYMHHFFRVCIVGQVSGGCSGKLEAHHLLSRGKVLTRHEPENGVILCSLHHKFSLQCSPHMAPIQFSEFLREHYPHKIEYVQKNTHRTGKPNFKEAYESLQELLDEN